LRSADNQKMRYILQLCNRRCQSPPMSEMNRKSAAPPIPTAAMRAFEKAERADWSRGLPLAELLDRVNAVAAVLLPAGDGRDSRVSRVFSPRSLRRYQTLGCIDAPQRDGQRVVYGFRHLVQALLVRKLLWERVSAERIAALMAGRGTAETRSMLLEEGVEMVARDGGAGSGAMPGGAETWRRVQVAPGIELHLRDDRPKLKSAELKSVLAQVETGLRRRSR